jgi:hypothetical protein
MQTILRTITLKLLIAALVGTCLFVGAANAQSSRQFQGKFTLPYEVRWGDAVLPPGEYWLRIEQTSSLVPVIVSVTATNGKRFFLHTPITSTKVEGPSALFVTLIGNQYRVRTLTLAEAGIVLVYHPLTPREKELIKQARETQAVPVIAAKK